MSKRNAILAAALLGAGSAAQAEVVSAAPNGFEVRHSLQLTVPPATVYAAFGQIGGWWSKDHTYSGSSANLRLSLSPGGCFCERFPDGGGVEHMRVTYLDPGKRVLMTGALGPLLYEAVVGVMDVQFERIAGGARFTLSYRAAGFAKGNGVELAPQVDKVIGEQVKRFRAFAVNRPRAL
ncbi:MAG TPA: ATPase [Sphingomicrobium sp.]|nr:ATPase [Sphingomicrobium sp.]